MVRISDPYMMRQTLAILGDTEPVRLELHTGGQVDALAGQIRWTDARVHDATSLDRPRTGFGSRPPTAVAGHLAGSRTVRLRARKAGFTFSDPSLDEFWVETLPEDEQSPRELSRWRTALLRWVLR